MKIYTYLTGKVFGGIINIRNIYKGAIGFMREISADVNGFCKWQKRCGHQSKLVVEVDI